MKYTRGNVIYYPQGQAYAIVFYNNHNSYFLVSTDKVPLIEPHTWTYDKTRGEPITTIGGKKVRLSRFVSDTPPDLVCDHINGIVADNRECNLRNCTTEQNNFNREKYTPKVEQAGDKYRIKSSSKKTASDTLFDTKEEAEQKMHSLVNYYQGEFSFWNSQEIAKKNESYEFKDYLILGGVCEEINGLPEKNIYKRRLKNILRDSACGKLNDEQFLREWQRLKSDYREYKKESA